MSQSFNLYLRELRYQDGLRFKSRKICVYNPKCDHKELDLVGLRFQDGFQCKDANIQPRIRPMG